jgi:hypothetical protein
MVAGLMNAGYSRLGEVQYSCAALALVLVSEDLEVSCVNLGSLLVQALGRSYIFPTAAG